MIISTLTAEKLIVLFSVIHAHAVLLVVFMQVQCMFLVAPSAVVRLRVIDRCFEMIILTGIHSEFAHTSTSRDQVEHPGMVVFQTCIDTVKDSV